MPYRVVVGVDGSLASVRALDRAAEEAVRFGCAVRVVYAVPDRDEAGPVLAHAVSRLRARCPGVPVEVGAAEGDPVGVLARESEAAVLTVIGSRGLGALAGFVRGAVAPRLVARAGGPLMVVRGALRRDRRRDVLLALERDTDADAAVYALGEAERRTARLRVLHPGVRPRPIGAAALRPHPLMDATRTTAVVVAATRAGRPGPVAHALLHHAHCPVVFVPGGG
ncbi:universal stress protein [Streptomyces sp. NPDC093252]|uniref:universal stress protein n=1 Tax=Streptomyces sp. NPDC093252 TaxID=3154980 RepID=UPI0034184A07